MEAGSSTFSIDELARAAEISSSTIRYYQGKGLLDPPRREGRHGVYGLAHLRRLRHITRLQERGFSLAAIAEIVEADKRGDTVASLLSGAHEVPDHELQTLVQEAFPDNGVSAPAIQNAIDLGALRVNDDGVLELSSEEFRPLVFSILHLFTIGLSEERAFEVWATVSERAADLADVFIQAATEFGYPDRPTSDHADIFFALTKAADQVVLFAFHAALTERLREDPSSVWG